MLRNYRINTYLLCSLSGSFASVNGLQNKPCRVYTRRGMRGRKGKRRGGGGGGFYLCFLGCNFWIRQLPIQTFCVLLHQLSVCRHWVVNHGLERRAAKVAEITRRRRSKAHYV